MNAGIELLLKRMDSHPEEFTGPMASDNALVSFNSRWYRLIHTAISGGFIPPEEIDRMKEKLNALQSEKFASEVMKELMDPSPRTTVAAQSGLVNATMERYSGGFVNAGMVRNQNTTTASLQPNRHTTTLATIEDLHLQLADRYRAEYAKAQADTFLDKAKALLRGIK